jgi:hypothetical protein
MMSLLLPTRDRNQRTNTALTQWVVNGVKTVVDAMALSVWR